MYPQANIPWLYSSRELYRPSGRHLIWLVERVACSAQRILTAVNVCFLDRGRHFSFKELLNYPHEAEWTTDPLLLGKCGSALIEPGTPGSVARNSNHLTTEAVRLNTPGN
jgi:hypothetical protein